MNMKLSDFIALGLQVERDCEFDCFAKVSDTVNGQALSYLDNIKYYSALVENRNIVAVITNPEYVSKCLSIGLGVAVAMDSKLSFIKLHNSTAATQTYLHTSISNSTVISPKADISDVGVIIGSNSVIEDNVIIYPGVKVGDNCIIKRGSTLGCQNFERCRDENGQYIAAIHIGHLVVGDYVTIGEDVKIDKAMFSWDSTVIDDNCFIGRGSDIGHGTRIGKNSTLISNVSICGYVTIGKNVNIGCGAIVSNRLIIGDDAIITLGSVVTKNVANLQRVSGNFAIPHDDYIRFIKSISLQKS